MGRNNEIKGRLIYRIKIKEIRYGFAQHGSFDTYKPNAINLSRSFLEKRDTTRPYSTVSLNKGEFKNLLTVDEQIHTVVYDVLWDSFDKDNDEVKQATIMKWLFDVVYSVSLIDGALRLHKHLKNTLTPIDFTKWYNTWLYAGKKTQTLNDGVHKFVLQQFNMEDFFPPGNFNTTGLEGVYDYSRFCTLLYSGENDGGTYIEKYILSDSEDVLKLSNEIERLGDKWKLKSGGGRKRSKNKRSKNNRSKNKRSKNNRSKNNRSKNNRSKNNRNKRSKRSRHKRSGKGKRIKRSRKSKRKKRKR